MDLNTIPSAAIRDVEVISGGAAAVYGADAISGVVNIITKKNFQGAQFGTTYGITQEGDGQEYQLGALFGTNYADSRGGVMFGASYSDRGEIRGKDRSWIRAGWGKSGTTSGGTVPGASISVPSTVAIRARCRRRVFIPARAASTSSIRTVGCSAPPIRAVRRIRTPGRSGTESGFKINPNGQLGFFDQRCQQHLGAARALLAVCVDDLQLQRTHHDVHGRAFHGEQQHRVRHTRGAVQHLGDPVPYNAAFDDPASPTFGQGGTTFAHHPEVPRELKALLNSRKHPQPDHVVLAVRRRRRLAACRLYRTDTTNNVCKLITSLRGDLPFTRDWTWEVYGSHGKTSQNAHLPESFLSLPRVRQLFRGDQYGGNWR